MFAHEDVDSAYEHVDHHFYVQALVKIKKIEVGSTSHKVISMIKSLFSERKYTNQTCFELEKFS